MAAGEMQGQPAPSDGGTPIREVDDPVEKWRWPGLRAAQRSILRDVLVHGPRSRADLTRRSGLSRASLSRLTRELAAVGLVREGAALQQDRRGRPSERIELVPEAAYFVGFKLTGNAVYLAVTDLAARVVHSEGQPLTTTAVGDVVAQMAHAVRRISARFGRVAAVGVCLAGDVRYEDGKAVVVGSAFLGWDQVGLETLLSAATGHPVAVSNDVQALTTAHHWFGLGVGKEPFVIIALGEGIGSGIVLDSDVVKGAHGRAGRVGHLAVTEGGPSCDRGHVGCVSAYATVPAILRNSGAEGFWETLEEARRGDPLAATAFRNAGTALGAAVATLVNIVDPERVLVTGEALAVAEFASAQMHESIRLRLDPGTPFPDVQLGAFEFTDYAWGAAITAIRVLV